MLDIQSTYLELVSNWDRALKPHGVPELPPMTSPPSVTLLQLIYLRHHYQEAVDKNEIGHFVQKYVPDASLDQQCRHWKSKGWDVQGRGGHDGKGMPLPASCYCLTSLGPSADFMRRRTRDLGRVVATDFNDLINCYERRCGMCGKEPSKGQSLEQGHMDPRKPLDLSNVIPICPSCNKWQLNRFVVDEGGRIVTVLAEPRNRALFKGLDERERRILTSYLKGG